MSNQQDHFEVKPDQWFWPYFSSLGIGQQQARRLTAYLYSGVCNLNSDSNKWERVAPITQFDRVLAFAAVAAGSASTSSLSFPTNNRNWILLQRQVVVIDSTSLVPAYQDQIKVAQTVPGGATLMETSPVSLWFGSGERPYYMSIPEEWDANVTRTFTVTNTAAATRDVTLGFKFLQVRGG